MQLCKKTDIQCTGPDNQHTTVIHATYVGSQGKKVVTQQMMYT